ncbi:MAG: aldo/keto reductase [Thaumarchaeota archaeon]|nr:aldo/keto reductase [Nitrososphaerota archaeon]
MHVPQTGFATVEGTLRYRDRGVKKGMEPRHFRSFLSLFISSLGAGTYLGEADSLTDRLVEEAVYESVVSGGVNVIDTAINYRMQKAERAIGRTLERLTNEGSVKREELFISTKNGYLTSDGDLQKDFWSYVQEEYIRPGKLKVDEIAGEVHSMAPRFLLDQLGRSLENLGVECIDLVYLHNAAESWIPEIGYRRFLERVADVFSLYEKKRSEGKLRYYGFASWNCFRVSRGEQGYTNLDDLVEVANNVGGAEHGFRFIQLPFNPAMNEALSARNQRIADEPLTTFEAAQKLGLGVFTSAPFAEGRLLNHTRVPELEGSRALSLLQFARSAHSAVIAPLVGQKDPVHVRENIRIGTIPPLTGEEFAERYGMLLGKR